MKSSALWLLCLIGVALINKGSCKPADAQPIEDYADDEQDGDEEEEEDLGPPPQLKTDPQRFELRPGVAAILPCLVEGNPDGYTRLWRKDIITSLFVGHLKQTNDERISLTPDGSLEIRAVNSGDEGSYLCQISSSPPQNVTHSLGLQRDKAPLRPAAIMKILPNDKVVNVKKSKSLELECIAAGVPDPEIHWFKDGHRLPVNDPIRKGVYYINEVTLEDQGIYECRAANGQDVPASRKVEVNVLNAPEIEIERDVVTTGEGYESELKCTITGYKTPEVKWYKNDHLLRNTENIKMEVDKTEYTLRILKTKVEDFGEYTCRAKNTEGESKAVMILTGLPSKPRLTSTETDESTKNPVVHFETDSFSPVVEYELEYKDVKEEEWKVAKPIVEPSTGNMRFRTKYTLSDQAAGVYKIKLRAKNAHGWSDSSLEYEVPKEHAPGGVSEQGPLAVESSSAELRISLALLISLLVAQIYC